MFGRATIRLGIGPHSSFFSFVAKNPETIDWTQYWNPLIYVDNTVGDPKESICRSVLYDVERWEAFFVERRRVKGSFVENLELFHFPFDTQVTVVIVVVMQWVHGRDCDGQI